MAAPALFGSQFLVNVETSGGEDSPSVAGLKNGNFVVAWEDNAAGFSNDGQYRVYHADGTPLTGTLPLNTSLDGNQGRPVVAALTNGDFVVAWRDNAGGDFDVKARIYHGDGSPAGNEFAVSQDATLNEDDLAIAALAGGGFVVSWSTEFDALNRDIDARAFNAAGTALGNEFHVIANSGYQVQPTVTGLTNGNYVIAWTDDVDLTGQDKSGTHIAASIFSGNGTAAGPTNFRVNTEITGDQSEPAVVGLSNGNFVVLWTTPGKSLDIAETFVSSGGSYVDSFHLIGSDSNQFQAAAAASNGQFYLSWTDSVAVAADNSGTHIGAARHANGAPGLLDPFVANTKFVNGDQSESTITALTDGRILVVWTDGGLSPGAPDPAPNAVYGQIFDPRTEAVSLAGVGLLNDEWIGTRFNDAMDGFAGNDHIEGGAGNDNILGGLGNDTLFGGIGNDTLTGGGGRDLFVFNTAFKPAKNVDAITDFIVADDTIELENALFAKLKKVGVLQDKFFEIGKHAADHNDYLVYNKKTGVLSYDKDGDGHKHGIAIAQLTDHLQLTGNDFLVV